MQTSNGGVYRLKKVVPISISRTACLSGLPRTPSKEQVTARTLSKQEESRDFALSSKRTSKSRKLSKHGTSSSSCKLSGLPRADVSKLPLTVDTAAALSTV